MSRADIALLLALTFCIGLLYARFWTPAAPAAVVHIQAPDTQLHLPLDTPRDIEVRGPRGTSMIRIAEGRARFMRSPCRHQICVRSGWHGQSGAVAACVPNRISLRLDAGPQHYDALGF